MSIRIAISTYMQGTLLLSFTNAVDAQFKSHSQTYLEKHHLIFFHSAWFPCYWCCSCHSYIVCKTKAGGLKWRIQNQPQSQVVKLWAFVLEKHLKIVNNLGSGLNLIVHCKSKLRILTMVCKHSPPPHGDLGSALVQKGRDFDYILWRGTWHVVCFCFIYSINCW